MDKREVILDRPSWLFEIPRSWIKKRPTPENAYESMGLKMDFTKYFDTEGDGNESL